MHFVHVWQGNLSPFLASAREFAHFLDKQEQAKLSMMNNPSLSQRYILVRAALRIVLAKYLNQEPERLKFSTSLYGKPFLQACELAFNISHSENELVIAVSDMQQIGIDIELLRPGRRISEIAKRCFNERELHFWKNLALSDRDKAFYQIWTNKEAFVKAVGRGVALGLSSCEISLSPEPKLTKIPSEFGLAENWKLFELALGEHIVGALVTPNKLLNLEIKNLDCFPDSIKKPH
jgi:4'-phosphopantetheinyl transferase